MVPSGWHVRDAEGKAMNFGERVNPDAFNAAVSLINVWKGAPKYFEWTKAHGLTLRDDHGWLVYFGSASQMDDKVTALNIVTSQLEKDKRNISFVDLGSGLPYYQEVAGKAPTTTVASSSEFKDLEGSEKKSVQNKVFLEDTFSRNTSRLAIDNLVNASSNIHRRPRLSEDL